MSKGSDYVGHFYQKYKGRIAISVGYDIELSEVFPFVFQNKVGESIGIVALGVTEGDNRTVYIYHLGAFIARQGDGSKILKELCRQADKFDVYLNVSAIFISNGKDEKMKPGQLDSWYKRFGFTGDTGLARMPNY